MWGSTGCDQFLIVCLYPFHHYQMIKRFLDVSSFSLLPFPSYQNQLVLLHCQPAVFFVTQRGLKKYEGFLVSYQVFQLQINQLRLLLSFYSFISTSAALSGLFNMWHHLSKFNDFAVKGLLRKKHLVFHPVPQTFLFWWFYRRDRIF